MNSAIGFPPSASSLIKVTSSLVSFSFVSRRLAQIRQHSLRSENGLSKSLILMFFIKHLLTIYKGILSIPVVAFFDFFPNFFY